jgi:hypothetical protein
MLDQFATSRYAHLLRQINLNKRTGEMLEHTFSTGEIAFVNNYSLAKMDALFILFSFFSPHNSLM